MQSIHGGFKMLELSFFPIGACNVMLRQFKAAASIAPQSHVVIRKIGVSTGTALGAHEVACGASEGLDGCRLGFGVKICWSHRSNILWSDIEKGGRYKTNFLLADVVVVVVVAVGVVVVVNPQLLVIFNGVNISIKCQLLLVNKYMMYQ